jgi:predicted Zn-dependent peptidase
MDCKRYTNGFRVIFDEMPFAYSCSIQLCVGAGLRFEDAAQTGVSHMLEHMLFKGTKSRSALELATAAEDCGANVNAFTSKEYTSLSVRALPEHVCTLLALLADMLIHSRFDAADLEIEKKVVREEIAMYEDSPDDLVFDIFYENVWKEHALGKNILGTRETLQALTADILRTVHRERYTPENIVLSVCGKFDTAAAAACAEDCFAGLPRVALPPPAPDEQNAATFRAHRVCTQKDLDQNQVVLAFPGFAGNAPQRYKAALVGNMLGGSTSSRLFQKLREELGLVYSVEFFHVHHKHEGVSGVCMGLSEKNQVRATEETLAVLRRFADTVTQAELRRQQEQAAAALVMSLESTGARASRSGYHTLLYDAVKTVDETIAAYRAVTLEEIRDFARDYLRPGNQMSLCVLGKIRKRDEARMCAILDA